MANSINLKDAKTGKTYTLEFNRDTIRIMEMNGFKIDEVLEQPMTYVPRLFAGAFRMHHKGIKQKELDRLYASIGGEEDQTKYKLVAALMEMYADTVNVLFDNEIDEGEQGNVTWEKNW